MTTRGKGSLRSAVLGHNVDFHRESDCVDNVQPDNVICAKNRCQPQIVIFHSLTLVAGVTGSSVDPHSVQQVPTDSFRCSHLRNRKTLFSKVDQLSYAVDESAHIWELLVQRRCFHFDLDVLSVVG